MRNHTGCFECETVNKQELSGCDWSASSDFLALSSCSLAAASASLCPLTETFRSSRFPVLEPLGGEAPPPQREPGELGGLSPDSTIMFELLLMATAFLSALASSFCSWTLAPQRGVGFDASQQLRASDLMVAAENRCKIPSRRTR